MYRTATVAYVSLLSTLLVTAVSTGQEAVHLQASVAVCFYGLTRSLRSHTFDSINKYIFESLRRQRFQFDVYLHTYNLARFTNPRSKEFNVSLDPEEWRILAPLEFLIDSVDQADQVMNLSYYLKLGNPWPDDPSGMSLRNHLRALFSIQSCFKLIEKKGVGRYMYVIFARPDVKYVRELPNIRQLIVDNRTLGVKFIDRFAVGKPSAVRHWANRFESASVYLRSRWSPQTHREHSKGLHSENLVKFHLYHNGVKSRNVPNFCFIRVRGNGCLKKLDCHACKYKCASPLCR